MAFALDTTECPVVEVGGCCDEGRHGVFDTVGGVLRHRRLVSSVNHVGTIDSISSCVPALIRTRGPGAVDPPDSYCIFFHSWRGFLDRTSDSGI